MVGIFGGSFDPIHNGHLEVAFQVRDRLNLKIFFALTKQNPLKERALLSYEERFHLLNLAIKEHYNFYALKEEYIYAIDLVKKIKKDFNLNKIYFITGLDSFLSLKKWKNYKELLKETNFIICSRGKKENKEVFLNFLKDLNINSYKILDDFYTKYNPQNEKIIYLKIPYLEISSTLIKNYIKHSFDLYPYLPEKVYKYLKIKIERGKLHV